MDAQRHTSDTTTQDAEPTPESAAPTPVAPVIVEQRESASGGFSLSSFLIGVLTTLVVGAIGVAVFLAVSDSDDDGNLELDVPAVDVDIDG